MIINLKNYHLEVIGKCLNFPMPFQKGRIKMRFLKLLQDKQDVCNKSRVEMLEQFADKDENKKPIIENSQYKLSPQNLVKFNEEFQKLMDEECPVDVPESMKNDIPLIRMIISESSAMLDNRETVVMEQVIEALKDTPKEKGAPAPKVSKK